jgi:hypothetical protein
VYVIKVFKDRFQLDTRFDVDFNAAFPTGLDAPPPATWTALW